MEHFLIAGVCLGGLVLIGLWRAVQDRRVGYAYWQPWRVAAVCAPALLFIGLLAWARVEALLASW